MITPHFRVLMAWDKYFSVYPLFKSLMTRTWGTGGYPERKLETMEANTLLLMKFFVLPDFWYALRYGSDWERYHFLKPPNKSRIALVPPRVEKSNPTLATREVFVEPQILQKAKPRGSGRGNQNCC